jgi:hypothetical protein
MLDKLPATNTAEFMQSLQQTTIGNADRNTCNRLRKLLRNSKTKETK